MNTQSILEAALMIVVVVGSVTLWMSLIGDIIENRNRRMRARARHNNKKPARLTYGDESPDEVERMYREAGLIK